MRDSRYKGPEVRMSLTYWRNSKKASIAPVGEVRGRRKEGGDREMDRSLYKHMFSFLIKKFLLFILAALGAGRGTCGPLVGACRGFSCRL